MNTQHLLHPWARKHYGEMTVRIYFQTLPLSLSQRLPNAPAFLNCVPSSHVELAWECLGGGKLLWPLGQLQKKFEMVHFPLHRRVGEFTQRD